MVDICKSHLTDEGEKENGNVYKEHICRQIDLFIKLQHLLWLFYQITWHRDILLTGVLYFQSWDILALYFVIQINFLYRHWKIFDWIDLYDLLLVFNWWITNRGKNFPCLFSSLDEEQKVFILWIIVMHTATMHSGMNIVLSVFFMMENKNLI